MLMGRPGDAEPTGRVLTNDEQRQLNSERLDALRARNRREITELEYLTILVSLLETFEQPVSVETTTRIAELQREGTTT
tara:strand:+ start:99 stop:335 length:237 start_codon:yes stop_codon:yes gene_type:complete